MEKEELFRIIQIASKRQPADFVIKNCKIVNVFTHKIMPGDIALAGSVIAGIGNYDGIETVDANGMYALPGLIDSHIHIESSFMTPEEFGRAVVPHGTTTTVSDPHEIMNVCGMEGLDYMIRAARHTSVDILYMMPSCVPCTDWEHSGANINAEDMRKGIHRDGVLGIGEFMNAYGILAGNEDCLNKLIMAKEENVIIDGHSPGLSGDNLTGYIAAGVKTDHECSTIDEMKERLEKGMYVELRLGSAASDLAVLAPGVNAENSRRCLLCSDDRQPGTICERGEMDDCLRECVQHGIDPVTAVQMATINAAECYRLEDRGAIAPGRRADIVLVDNLKNFNVEKVFIKGELVADSGRYLKTTEKEDITPVKNCMHVKDFKEEKLRLNLRSSSVHVMDIQPGTLISKDEIFNVDRDENGDFIFNVAQDVARISVIERHKNTGNVANALIHGYGIKTGALAVSVGHDSHNILTVGTNTEDMYFAVSELINLGGGIILVDKGRILERMELPVAGLMSTLPAEEAAEKFKKIRSIAVETLGVNKNIDPILTLCFMSLPVIPEIKLTDMGLFNVEKQQFIDLSN